MHEFQEQVDSEFIELASCSAPSLDALWNREFADTTQLKCGLVLLSKLRRLEILNVPDDGSLGELYKHSELSTNKHSLPALSHIKQLHILQHEASSNLCLTDLSQFRVFANFHTLTIDSAVLLSNADNWVSVSGRMP